MKTLCFLLLGAVFLFRCQEALTQVKPEGIPIITNYTVEEYSAGRQSWDIVQDENGFIYFANNSGVLEYDGNDWNLYPFPNRSVVRAVSKDYSGRIYAGGYNDFGYLEADRNGEYYLKSLAGMIEENKRDFGEVWKIHSTPGGTYFQSYKAIYHYYDNTVRTLAYDSDFHFSFYLMNRLFIQHRTKGLLELSGNDLVPVRGGSAFDREREIWSMLPFDAESILIGTQFDGLYLMYADTIQPFKSPINEFLRENQIFSSRKIDPGYYAYGTIQNGLVVIDSHGEIIQHINRNKGLLNNTILSLYLDRNRNLWLGLDNGITYIEINSPFSFFREGHGIYGAGYCAIEHKGYVYFGTNQGLFFREGLSYVPGEYFELIPETKGQVWVLKVIGDVLLCGHNKGTFVVRGEKAHSVSSEPGSWNFVELPGYPGKILCGTYNGIFLYETDPRLGIRQVRKIKGFDESSREIYQDPSGDIWISHGYKGVYRLHLNESLDSVKFLKLYDIKDGLPSNFASSTFTLRNKMYVSTSQGIFSHDPYSDLFIRDITLNRLFQDQPAYRPVEDDKGNIWYVNNNSVDFLEKNSPANYIIRDHVMGKFDHKMIASYENIYFTSDHDILIGLEDGFLHYDPVISVDTSQSISVYIRKIQASNEFDTIVLRNQKITSFSQGTISFPFSNNNIQFSFAAPDYSNQKAVQYSYKLDGFHSQWSSWNEQTFKEFNNLPPGTYTFLVKSKNVYSIESLPAEFGFVIIPPWYRSVVANIIYVLLFLSVFTFLIRLSRRRREMEKRKLEKRQKEELEYFEARHAREKLEIEKEIMELKNAKLQAEMAQKTAEFDLQTKELASVAIQIKHKNEILGDLREKIKQVSLSNSGNTDRDFARIIKDINAELRLDQDWDRFKLHFEKVHADFFKRLHQKYPHLTPNDLKLCAYLRMNLSSKEIAPLMNISVRGVEISRYRLRKKLALDKVSNLIEFMFEV